MAGMAAPSLSPSADPPPVVYLSALAAQKQAEWHGAEAQRAEALAKELRFSQSSLARANERFEKLKEDFM